MLWSFLRTGMACALVISPLSLAAQEILEPPPGMVLPDEPAPATDPAEDGDVVVARIGNAEIRLTEVIGDMYSLPDDERNAQPFDELYEELLQYRIDRTMVLQAALAAGIQQRPEHVERMQRLEERVLTETFMENIVRAKVTPAAVKERYEAYAQDDAARTERRARHILAEDEADATAIKARLDGGEDFETIARSMDYPGSDKGGDLGFIVKGSMVAEIVEASEALQVGEISDPFQSQFGWHLIKLEETRVADPQPIEQMREQLFNQMSQEIVEEVLVDLRSSMPVERFNRDGTPVGVAADETAPAEEAVPAE